MSVQTIRILPDSDLVDVDFKCAAWVQDPLSCSIYSTQLGLGLDPVMVSAEFC